MELWPPVYTGSMWHHKNIKILHCHMCSPKFTGYYDGIFKFLYGLHIGFSSFYSSFEVDFSWNRLLDMCWPWPCIAHSQDYTLDYCIWPGCFVWSCVSWNYHLKHIRVCSSSRPFQYRGTHTGIPTMNVLQCSHVRLQQNFHLRLKFFAWAW